jgi:hypothetical protein
VLIDRELYLPESWFADPARLADAGVAARTVFATEPELAWRMIERAAMIRCWCSGGSPAMRLTAITPGSANAARAGA